MANPKPTHTLTSWRVLTTEEAKELVDGGRLLRQTEPPPPTKFTDGELSELRKGQPLFVIWKGNILMVAMQKDSGYMIAFDVEERRPTPPPTVCERVKRFFKNIKF